MSFAGESAQIYIRNSAGVRMSLAAAAPVDTDIPLGVVLPATGSYVIALPDKDTYNDCSAVMVIDKQTGASANLLNEDFLLTSYDAGDISDRLVLRFSATGITEVPVSSPMPTVMKVSARNGCLPLRNLDTDTSIEVYNTSGLQIYKGRVADISGNHIPDGVYMIRIR